MSDEELLAAVEKHLGRPLDPIERLPVPQLARLGRDPEKIAEILRGQRGSGMEGPAPPPDAEPSSEGQHEIPEQVPAIAKSRGYTERSCAAQHETTENTSTPALPARAARRPAALWIVVKRMVSFILPLAVLVALLAISFVMNRSVREPAKKAVEEKHSEVVRDYRPHTHSSPLDHLDPSTIPPEERCPEQPDELVAVLGSRAGRHWG